MEVCYYLIVKRFNKILFKLTFIMAHLHEIISNALTRFRVQHVDPFIQKKVTLDPWYMFKGVTIPDQVNVIFNNFMLLESSLFNLPANNQLRQSLTAYPGFVGFGFNPKTELNIQIAQDQKSDKTSNTIRTRSFQQGNIGLMVWIAAWTYASDPTYRLKFIREFQFAESGPAIFSSAFQQTRQSRCDNVEILPTLSSASSSILLTVNPSLVGTPYDPKWLLSEVGFVWFSGFLSFLRTSQGNYIPFVNFTINAFPPLLSGNTTTLFSIVSHGVHKIGEYSAVVLLGSSLPLKVSAIFFEDALTLDLRYCNLDLSPAIVPATEVSRKFECSYDSQSLQNHVIIRTCGLYKGNSPSKQNKPPGGTPPTDSSPDHVIITPDMTTSPVHGIDNPTPDRLADNARRKARTSGSRASSPSRDRSNSRHDSFSKFEKLLDLFIGYLSNNPQYEYLFA
jgi:hypothetical protein